MFIIIEPITVSFEEQSYFIDESTVFLQPALLLSKSLQTDIIIEVLSTNRLATGKFCQLFLWCNDMNDYIGGVVEYDDGSGSATSFILPGSYVIITINNIITAMLLLL